jgi:hypothetical protein
VLILALPPLEVLGGAPCVVDDLPPEVRHRFNDGGMVTPLLPPGAFFFEAVFPDLVATPAFFSIDEEQPFVPRPPTPPRPRPPKRGGPAAGSGGGGWREPDCGPDQIYDPVRDECVDIFGRPKDTVYEELGALPTPGAAAPSSMYQLAKLLGPGWASYAATKVAGKLATDTTGSKHAGTVANLGTFAASIQATKWRRLEGYRGRIIMGSAIGALDDVVKRYLDSDPKLTHQPLASADRLVSTARAVGKPIEAKAIPHRAKDGKSVVILRYTVTVGSTVMYWQEARPVVGGEINLAGTLLEQLRRVP